MGSLTLPSNGPVYLDASGFIYSVERIQPYSDLLEPMWRAGTGRTVQHSEQRPGRSGNAGKATARG